MSKVGVVQKVIEEIKTLPEPQLRELRTYVYFLKMRWSIDPSQLYFWTKRWQAWEKEAEADKRMGRVIGDGTVEGLLKALKQTKSVSAVFG